MAFADQKESLEVEKVTLQHSLVDIAATEHESEHQKDTCEKHAAGEDTEVSDASNALSCIPPDGTQIPVPHQKNSVDFDESFNTMVNIGSEENGIPTSETMTVAQIIEQETDTQTVPNMTIINENGMNNTNMMKENSTAGNFNSMSMKGLKKMLKKLGSYKEGKRVNQKVVTKNK